MEVQRFHFMKHFAGFTLPSFMGGKKKPLIKLCADALAVGIHAALLTEDSYFRLQAQPHLPMALTMAIYNS